MIDEIQVEYLALIRSASMQPADGMTVLTGETGAGKTALVSACKLLMGERSDRNAVRDGAEGLRVAGRFVRMRGAGGLSGADGLPDGGRLAHACDAEAGDGLVVTRTVKADGRSRMEIDGRMASASEVRGRVGRLVDLCGQHEHQQLMRPGEHLRMLDAWAAGDVVPLREAFREAFDAVAKAKTELEQVRDAAQASSAKLDEARFVCRRIGEVGPREGEYEELSARLAKAEHAESLATAVSSAHDALAGDGGALDAASSAIAALDDAARHDDSLAAYAGSLREASYVLEDVARDAAAYAASLEFDEAGLREGQERMAQLQGLLHAYGPRMEDVLAAWGDARELLSLVDDAAQREKAAVAALDAAEGLLRERASALERVREEAAPRFAEAVTEQMGRLEMGGAQLECAVTGLPREAWTASGPQAVEFLFRPGAGMRARPFARIASGGEISRVMLAVKVVLGERDGVDTLIFDEVDAGVGGTAATALADVLADLATTHQVLVITHLPQVAVRAKRHYLVSKSSGDCPETTLRLLAPDERPAEIARMLSGSTTEASLAHAREMLEAAVRA